MEKEERYYNNSVINFRTSKDNLVVALSNGESSPTEFEIVENNIERGYPKLAKISFKEGCRIEDLLSVVVYKIQEMQSSKETSCRENSLALENIGEAIHNLLERKKGNVAK